MKWIEDGEDEGSEERPEDLTQAPANPPHLPAPWEVEEPEDEEGKRQRHDAFTPARRNAFLKVLAKTGCILDACRLTGVSSRTIYYHQGQDYTFLKHCGLAISMCETPVELTAWERGVVGVEEEVVICGKLVPRIKRSDSVLRLLLQGANPKKYGARPGFKRKRLLKHERKQMEREIRAEISSQFVSDEDEACAALAKRLKAFGVRTEEEETQAKLAAGWARSEEGHWVPPGYVRLLPGDGGEPEDSRDSV